MKRSNEFDTQDYTSLSKAIRNRRTWKVLGDPQNPTIGKLDLHDEIDSFVMMAMRESGLAPFHYDRNLDGVPEPWRFYFLRQSVCRSVARKIPDWFDDVRANNKLPAMLSACGSLVLVNWIPQFSDDTPEVDSAKRMQIDQEHLAATSAAIQNLLLLLTARNLGTYWSSGGLFRDPLMLEKLGINTDERLLGAIFVDYTPNHDQFERIPGKHRDRRSHSDRWIREIDSLED